MGVLLDHTVCLTGSVPALRYTVQTVEALRKRSPISPDMLRIVYIRQGHCDWIIAGKTYKVSAGDIVLLNNTEKRVQTDISETEPIAQEIIRFMPVAYPDCSGCLPMFFNRKPNYSNVLPRDCEGRKTVVELMELMRSEALTEKTDRNEAMAAILKLLLINIARIYSGLQMTYEKNTNNVSVNSTAYQLIFNSVEYIKDNLAGEISVDILSANAGISRSYYSRMFHAIMGMSVPQYVRTRRIIQVNDNVSSGNSVIDSVYAAGFGSLSAYYKALRDTGLR